MPDERLPEPVEAAAYYLIAEAITNVAKHAHASHVSVSVLRDERARPRPRRRRRRRRSRPGGRLGPARSRRPRRGAPRAPSRRQPTRRWHTPGGAHPGRMRASWWGAGLALAAASLALPSAPTYDPWAWLVFGREIAVPGPGFSTIASTGWKPLAVLFTAPLALTGSAAPSLWLVVVRFAGLAALRAGLPARGARRRPDRRGDRGARAPRHDRLAALPVGGQRRAVGRGAHARRDRAAPGRPPRRGVSCSARWPGWRAPRCGPSSGPTPSTSRLIDRRWWPLALGVPAMFALWIVPDWLGSGDLLHTFHLARISAEPVTLQGTGDPALELLRGTGPIAPAPVWIGALCGAGLRLAHPRSHRGRARLRRGGMGRVHRRGDRARLPGGAALPRRARGHLLRRWPGSARVAVVRLASGPRGRAVLAVALVAA